MSASNGVSAGKVVGGRVNKSTHKERTGNVMTWGNNGYPRVGTKEFRDGYDAAFGGEADKKQAQQARADEFKAWKESQK